MLRRFAFAATLFAFAGVLPTYGAVSPTPTVQAALVAQPPFFDTESASQAHCPKDVVVSLNIPSGIYRYKGERWYGRTKHSALCLREGRDQRW